MGNLFPVIITCSYFSLLNTSLLPVFVLLIPCAIVSLMFWDNLECKHLCFLLAGQVGPLALGMHLSEGMHPEDRMLLCPEDRILRVGVLCSFLWI